MPDKSTKNYGSLNYGDNPELVEEFSDMKAGDTGSARINYTVRRNEDGELSFDINEIVLPEEGVQPVSGAVNNAESDASDDVVGQVLNREKPAADELQ
jgi:hypothetical protein